MKPITHSHSAAFSRVSHSFLHGHRPKFPTLMKWYHFHSNNNNISHSFPHQLVKNAHISRAASSSHQHHPHETLQTDICIIGGGIIGTAISSRLAPQYPNHILLEQHHKPGQEISSRNSEVLHAGLYYKEGSLKSRLCREGNRTMYRVLRKWDIPHRKTGKWLLATNESEHEYLENLKQRNDAAADSLGELKWVKYAGRTTSRATDSSSFTPLEQVALSSAYSVLNSPESGIVDSATLINAFLMNTSVSTAASLSEDERGTHAFDSKVLRIEMERPEHYTITVQSGREIFQVKCNVLINAAGLNAGSISQDLIRSVSPNHADLDLYKTYFVKGDYFSYQQKGSAPLTNRLLYPVPDPNLTSLGVHLTLDMNQEIRFGPDVEYLGTERDKVHYRVDESKRDRFYESILKYLPEGIERDRLQPAYAGVRPKLQAPGDPFRDFIIREESDKGLPGFISLVGIESPGLTSSMSIANMVADMLGLRSKDAF